MLRRSYRNIIKGNLYNYFKNDFNKNKLKMMKMAENILKGHKYMLLSTFRKDGTSVPTPVWFKFSDGKIYFYSNSKAWKIKRIQKKLIVKNLYMKI